MSATVSGRTITPPAIQAMKGGTPIVSLTAYTTPVARLVDEHCDFVLVGDSLGVVVHGLPDTVGVTMEMMLLHARAVKRGLSRPLMVVDLPFGAYEAGPDEAHRNAVRLMKEGGAGAVKLEGGAEQAETIRFLTRRGIPVMAHIGLLPQAIHTLGGYKVQGRGDAAHRLMEDGHAVSDAGAFAVVVEKTASDAAAKLTAELPIPTIGIGASSACDGQILVIDDMLGLFEDFRPKFVKRYGEWAVSGRQAVAAYAEDVRARRFPGPEHAFGEEPGRKAGEKTK